MMLDEKLPETDLTGDVVPVMLAAQTLEVFFQQGSHLNNPICHALDLPQPLTISALVVENLRRDTCTVYRRVGVERPDKNLEL
jgi:hypothetical protein